jgi:hypothetical protein
VIQYGPPHVIRISLHMSPEDRLQTLLHEAAHAICHARWGPEEGHSRRFWTIARRLGVELGELCRWNGIENPSRHKLLAGTLLVVYAPRG